MKDSKTGNVDKTASSKSALVLRKNKNNLKTRAESKKAAEAKKATEAAAEKPAVATTGKRKAKPFPKIAAPVPKPSDVFNSSFSSIKN